MKFWRIFLGTCVFVLLTSIALLYYLNTTFIPVTLKQIISEKGAQLLKRKVAVREIRLDFPQGVVIEQLTIAGKDPNASPLMEIESINIGLAIPNLFNRGEILVPSVVIHRPTLSLIRNKDGQWNFADILEALPERKDSPQPGHETPSAHKTPKINLIISSSTIKDGSIKITDYQADPFRQEEILLPLLWARLNPAKIDFRAQINSYPRNGELKFSGSFSPLNKELKAHAQVKDWETAYHFSLLPIKSRLTIHNGSIDHASLDVNFKKSILTLSGPFAATMNLGIQATRYVTVKGRFETPDLNIEKTAEGFLIKTPVTTSGALVQVDKNKTFSADLFSSLLSIVIKPLKSVAIDGDIAIKNADFAIHKNQSYSGDFTAEKAHFDFADGDFNLTGHFTAENAKFTVPQMVFKGDLTAKNSTLKKTGAAIQLTTDAETDNGKIEGKMWSLTGKVISPQLSFVHDTLGFQIKVPQLTADTWEFIATDGKKATSTFTAQDIHYTQTEKTRQLKAKAETSVLIAEGLQKLKFTGRPSLDFTLDLNDGPDPFVFTGDILFAHDQIAGLWRGPAATALDGKVHFAAQHISTARLEFNLGKIPVTLSGSLNNFKEPQLDLTATSSGFNLDDLTIYFAKYLTDYKVTAAGQIADLSVKYKGLLSAAANADLMIEGQVSSGQFAWEKIPLAFKDISGHLRGNLNTLFWKDLNFSYDERTYHSAGNLSNFNAPVFDIELAGKDFTVAFKGQKKDAAWTFDSLRGQYHDKTSFDLQGHLDLQEQSAPDIALKGTVKSNFTELKHIPSLAGALTSLNPQGNVTFEGEVFVPKSVWKNLRMTAAANCAQVFLSRYQAQNVTLNINPAQVGGKHTASLAAQVYNGALQLTGDLSLSEDLIPFQARGRLTDLDLSLLKNDVAALKDKNFSGLFSLDTSLDGQFARLDRIKGQGAVKVDQGHLLEYSLLKGIWKLLLVKELQDITFTESKANFTIRDQNIETRDLVLKSEPLDIYSEGTIGFDGAVNLTVRADVRQAALLANPTVQGAVSTVLAGAQQYFGIKITGSLDSPKYTIKPLPMKAIQKTTGSILQGLGSILEDVLP